MHDDVLYATRKSNAYTYVRSSMRLIPQFTAVVSMGFRKLESHCTLTK